MSAGEISVFEKVWKLLWEFLYKVIAWLSGRTVEKDGTTAVLPDMDNITNPY